MGGPCAGFGLSMGYKMAVARYLLEDRLPRVGHDMEAARGHLQRALNALIAAPGAGTKQAAALGYQEQRGLIGNPVHGMAEEPGLGILPHLKKAATKNPRAKDAIGIVELAQQRAAAALKSEDVLEIKRAGRVAALLLQAAHEAIL